jgi:phosphoribosylanthranilate isomerase
MLPFKIKICGLTDPANVRPTVEAGAQALGLNFFASSKRYLADELIPHVMAQVPSQIIRVGVFVNATPQVIQMRAVACGLHFVQMHGDENIEDLKHIMANLSSLPNGPGVIKAIRLQSDPESGIGVFIDRCRKFGIDLSAVLIDAYSTAGHGGTGERADWTALGKWTNRRGVPLILAGGITPENVAEAIATVRPDAIDTASGVESAPGIKDPARVRALVQAAETAWKS